MVYVLQIHSNLGAGAGLGGLKSVPEGLEHEVEDNLDRVAWLTHIHSLIHYRQSWPWIEPGHWRATVPPPLYYNISIIIRKAFVLNDGCQTLFEGLHKISTYLIVSELCLSKSLQLMESEKLPCPYPDFQLSPQILNWFQVRALAILEHSCCCLWTIA